MAPMNIDSYSDSELFPCGTITLPLSPTTGTLSVAEPPTWNTFDLSFIQGRILNQIDFCVLNSLQRLHDVGFLAAKFTKVGDTLVIRVSIRLQGPPFIPNLDECREAAAMIFPLIIQCQLLWEGELEQGSGDLSTSRKFWKELPENIGRLYARLDSPRIRERVDDPRSGYYAELKATGLIGNMNSRLYPYQRQSVCVMLQHELDATPIPSPLLVRVVGLHNRPGFINPETLKFQLDEDQVSPVRGGVLCEEPGAGKTCIILAVIMLTLQQKSAVYSLQDMIRNLPLQRTTRLLLQNNDPIFREMIQTTMTLVLVPNNLLSQWNSEIRKHCVEGAVDALVAKASADIPNEHRLAKYDIVILPYNLVSRARVDIAAVRSCRCKLQYGICCCPEEKGAAALYRIHIKRLVIDEGKLAADQGSNFSQMVCRLAAERKWLVSGTPTKEMRSYNTTAQAKTDDADSLGSVSKPIDVESASHQSLWTTLDGIDSQLYLQIVSDSFDVPWLRENLQSEFLKSKLLGFGKIEVLNQIMHTIMIRHRHEDLIELPKLWNESVLLTLDPYALKSYNAMQSVLAFNIKDTKLKLELLAEAKNQPGKKKKTRKNIEAIKNVGFYFSCKPTQFFDRLHNLKDKNGNEFSKSINHILFWHVDNVELFSTIYDIDDEYDASAVGLEGQNLSIHNANKYRKQAQNDLTWNHLQYRQTVPFRIHNLPPFIFDFFDQNDGFYGRVLRDDKGTPFLYPRQLDFLKRSFETVGSSASQESLLSALKLHYRQFQSDVKENTLKRSHTNADFRKRQLNEQESKDIKRKIRELDLRETTGRQETQGGSKIVDGTKIIIGSSTSTKLNYILTEVKKYGGTSKFLIYSHKKESLEDIAIGLGMLSVPCLPTNGVFDVKDKAHDSWDKIIDQFKASDKHRVLLLSTNSQTHGLDLSVASRIIFCEPFMKMRDAEQAVKRAHRIGQMSDVSAKTLAIAGTYEECMTKNREDNKSGVIRKELLMEAKWLSYDGKEPFDFETPLVLDDHENRGEKVSGRPKKRRKVIFRQVASQ